MTTTLREMLISNCFPVRAGIPVSAEGRYQIIIRRDDEAYTYPKIVAENQDFRIRLVR